MVHLLRVSQVTYCVRNSLLQSCVLLTINGQVLNDSLRSFVFVCVLWRNRSIKMSWQEKINLPFCHHQNHFQALFAGKPILQVDFHSVLVKPFIPNESAKTFSRSCQPHKSKLLMLFQNDILLRKSLDSKNDGCMLSIVTVFINVSEPLCYIHLTYQVRAQLFKN